MGASRVLKITNGGEIDFFEPSAGGSSYVSVLAPALAASWSLTLPPDDGAADSLLRSDGAGVTTWVTSLTALGVTTLTVTDLIANDEVRIVEPGGASYVSIVAPALLANWTLTLPADDGVASSILMSDGSGTTSWVVALPGLDVDALTTDGLTVHNQGTVNFREAVAGGSDAVKLRAPAALAADVTFTLPGTDGGADDVLVTDGAGNLSFKETLASLTITALTSAGITITNEGLLTFREEAGHGVNEVTFKAPHALAADTDYTWPTAIVAGNFLQTDAGGNLSWAASAATLQTAYDAGEDIVMIADTIDISQANNNGMLNLTKTGAGAGDVIAIHNDGQDHSIYIHHDGTGHEPLHIQNDGTSDTVALTQTANSNGLMISKTGVGAGMTLSIHNDGTGVGLDIDQDGVAYALHVDQSAAAYGVYVEQSGAQSSLVTIQSGAAINAIHRQDFDSHVLYLHKNVAGPNGICLYITNAGTGQDVYSSTGGWQVSSIGAAQFPGICHPHSHEVIDAAGDITITAGQCFILVDTNAGAGDDNLDTITGGVDGQIIILRAEDTTHTVHVRDNSTSGGNIYNTSSGTFDMDNSEDTAMYIYDATAAKWLAVSLSNNGA